MNQKMIINLLEESFGNSYRKMNLINEASVMEINNELLLKLYRTITDKMNDLDYSEVEKSKGDINKFKYTNTLLINIDTLKDIYSTDSDMNIMMTYLNYIEDIYKYLNRYKDILTKAYDDSIISILYITSVNTMIQSLTLLSSATLTFVTQGDGEDIEVILDALPKPEKNMYLNNLKKLHSFWKDDAESFFTEYKKYSIKKINEVFSEEYVDIQNTYLSESFSGVITTIALSIGIVYLLFKLGIIIRECIYLMLNSRMRTGKYIEMQIDLLNANIEALKNRNISVDKKQSDKNNKIIAKQKWVVDKLIKIKSFLLKKFDDSERATIADIKLDNKELGLDKVNASQVLI